MKLTEKLVLTKYNTDRIALFLEDSVEALVKTGIGCCKFNLNEHLAIFVGWSDGFDVDDPEIILSPEDQSVISNHKFGWAINAGIKVRNDADWADYDMLNFPVYDDGEVYDCGTTIHPNEDYKKLAKAFILDFINIYNLNKDGKVVFW